jgi:hypothetical protein
VAKRRKLVVERVEGLISVWYADGVRLAVAEIRYKYVHRTISTATIKLSTSFRRCSLTITFALPLLPLGLATREFTNHGAIRGWDN